MTSFAIPIAFVLLASLLLWVLIGARGHWWLKLSLMVLTLLVGCSIKTSLSSYLGHPKPTSIKEMDGQTALLFWVRVQEPDTITYWMSPERESPAGLLSYPTKEPQIFQFPYSRDLHEVTQAFLAEILKRNGEPIEIMFSKPDDKKQGKPGAHGQGGEESDNSGSMSRAGKGMIYLLPPRKLPPKINQ